MKLINDFFTVEKLELQDPAQINAGIAFNTAHAIFKGHFPGSPVVPGVCQVQMIAELTNEALKKNYQITGALNIKYLAMINPEVNREVNFNIQYESMDGGLKVNAIASSGSVIFMKFKGELK